MAVAKNKLQDIYSSAVARLTELESSQSHALNQMYGKYHDTDEVARDDLKKNISDKQELLAQEIQSFVSNSMARILSAIDMQSSLTNNCLNRCTQNMVVSARTLEEQLNRTHTRQDVVQRDSLDELSTQFSAYVERSLMKFLQMQNEWSQQLRDKHTDLRSALEQAIVTDVANLRQYEGELTETVQSVAMGNMTRLRNETEQADEQLRARYQERSDELQSKLGELDAAFQKHRNAVMLEAEAQAKGSSKGLQSRFEMMYGATTSELADIVAKHKVGLKQSFDSVSLMLSNLLDKTQTEIAKAADIRTANIDERAKEARRLINSDVETLRQKLNSSFNISSKIEQELQKDNEEVSGKMRSDFSKLFDSFKKRMDSALEKSVKELSGNHQRAVQEISTAYKESQSAINSVSSSIASEIDPAAVQTVQRIRQARRTAIEKVERAAAGSSNSTDAAKHSPAPAPYKRSTISTDHTKGTTGKEVLPGQTHTKNTSSKETEPDAEVWSDSEIHIETKDSDGSAHE